MPSVVISRCFAASRLTCLNLSATASTQRQCQQVTAGNRLRSLPSLGMIRRGAGIAQRAHDGARGWFALGQAQELNGHGMLASLSKASSCHAGLFPTVWPSHPHVLAPTRRGLVRQAFFP